MADLAKGLQKKIHERDKNTCRYCGEPSEVVDHIVPRAKGGTDDPENLAAACQHCNRRKGIAIPANLGPDWNARGRRSGRNFAPMPLAVLASNAPPRAKLLILALFHHDWDGRRAWPSQERLSKIMSCSRDTVSEATKDCIAYGWILVKRRYSVSSMYELNIPDMNLEQFEDTISGIQLSGIPAKGNPDNTHRDSPPQMSEIPGITRVIEREPLNKSHSVVTKHPDQDAFWISAKETWAAKFRGAILGWPGAAGAPGIQGFQKLLTGHLTALGHAELARRWANCVNDPFSRPSLRSFIHDVDKWIDRRDGGGKTARAFNSPTPPTPWTPSTHAIPRT